MHLLFYHSIFAFQTIQSADSLIKQANQSQDPSLSLKLAKAALKIAINQSNKAAVIKSFNLISESQWSLRRYDSAKIYANKALVDAQRFQIDSLEGDAWLNLGMASYKTDDMSRSISDYQMAIDAYIKANNRSGLATAYLNIGISKQQISDYAAAIGYFLKSASVFEALHDDESLSYAYNSIAICFNYQRDLKKTLEYHKKALAIRLHYGNDKLISQSLNNIGFTFKVHNLPDSAIYYLSRSLDITRHTKDSSEMVLTMQNLGSVYTSKGNFNKAKLYILESLKIAERFGMTEEFARGNFDLAEIHLRQKNLSEGLMVINSVIKIAQRKKLLDLLVDAYGVKYEIYNEKGDYKNALLYLNKKANLKDSLFNSQKHRIVEELDAKYQTKQRVKDIENLSLQNTLQNKVVKQQRTSITILIISAALLIVLFAITYINFRAKQKANLRIQTLMRDLHHRVKNNLQILSGLFTMQIENLNDETTKNALRENEARLTSMNLIHNKLYLNNTTTKIEMSDYLTNLLTHIRDSFGSQKQNMIDLRIEVSNVMLEADKAVAIGLIANELATNAFKYAFNDQGGEIYLALKFVEKSKLLLTLCDNGIGIDDEKNKNKPPSFGLRLVNLMARQLNSTLVVTHNPGVSYQMEISV